MEACEELCCIVRQLMPYQQAGRFLWLSGNSASLSLKKAKTNWNQTSLKQKEQTGESSRRVAWTVAG